MVRLNTSWGQWWAVPTLQGLKLPRGVKATLASGGRGAEGFDFFETASMSTNEKLCKGVCINT